MNEIYPKRHWGLRGGPDSGKSTFLSANAERPLYVIDADGRFDFVRGLGKGDVIYPDTNKGSILPADIQEQATSNVLFSETDVKSIGVDSVTQIFIYQSRLASIRGNMSAAERKERGLGTNKASDMVDKSNAMAVLRTLAGFRTAVYYIWHTTEGRDHRGVEETRDVISKVELKRLFSTMAVILDFAKENGRYQVTVTWARGIDDRPANTGFTLTDTPGNFWRGGALRLERAMYTTLDAESQAIEWAMEKLGKGDYGEVEQHFQDVTRKYRDWPIKVAMFVDDIYSRVAAPTKREKPPESNGTVETVTNSSWTNVKVGSAVKVTGNSGTVDGVFKGIDGKLVKVEVDGKPFSVAAERVSIPADDPPGDVVVQDEAGDEVSADEWAQMNAAIDEARAEAAAEDMSE